MTLQDILNRFLFQWFFIRIVKGYRPWFHGSKWGVMYWVVPTTGYGNVYRYVGCAKYLWF